MNSLAIDIQPCRTTPEQYLARIQQDLPSGVIWEISNDQRTQNDFWKAIAAAFSEYQNERCDLYDELDPCRANLNINRWAGIFGFPFECAPAATADDLCAFIQLINSDCAGPTVEFYQKLLVILGVIDPVVIEQPTVVGTADCARAGCFVSGNTGECFSSIIIDADPASYVEDSSPFGNEACEADGFAVKTKYIPQVECIKRCFFPPNVQIIYGSCLEG